MSPISSFKGRCNKHELYRSKNFMKKVCESLRKHAMKIINFKEKEMKLLTNKQQELYENAKSCYICKQKFEDKYIKDKKYCKIRDHFHHRGGYIGAAHGICNLKFSILKEIPIAFHNGSNHDYNFTIKKLAEEPEEKSNHFVENTEKYIIFLIPIENEVTRIDKYREGITKTISYRSQFIDYARFKASPLSNLTDNLSE